jgi:regulation of enolase protein 1 (concanavalin A-like superfamily)
MNLREFMRFHLLKTLLLLVAIQIAIVAIIQNFNHRPQALPDHVSMIEGRSIKITPLSNDFDKDENDKLAISKVSTPFHGSLKQNGNLIYYTPVKEYTGIDSFEYRISDGRKESKSTWITILVNKNLKPVTSRDSVETFCKESIIIDVLKNDHDREGDSIFIRGYSKPIYGHLKVLDNKIVYFSDAATARTDSFLYVISDGKSNSDSAAVIIDVRSKNYPGYPWFSCDVGDAAKSGSLTSLNKTFIITASGSDIWNNNDGFHFVYQYVDGDCEFYTKVESLEGNHEWAKSGIMIRESLDGGSKNAFIGVTNKNGVTSQQRLNNNDPAEDGKRIAEVKAPYWIKMNRKGNKFSYYISANAGKWELLSSADIPMNRNVYIGFALTSHDNNEICKAVYSSFKLTSKPVKYLDAN